MAEKKPREIKPEELSGRIKEAAKRSGKPLEVVCARSFLEAPRIMASINEQREAWKVHLSSHYLDELSDKIRELDVLARRQRYVKVGDNAGFNAMLEVFMSCKGFPEDEYPITFAIRETVEVAPEDPPIAPTYVSLPRKCPELERDSVEGLLYFICDMNSSKRYALRRTIGMDVVRDLTEAGKDWKVLGDRELFEGLDGALRASYYWRRLSLPAIHSTAEGLLRVQIPVLVLSRPWHEIPVDGGAIGDPVPTTLSYIANLYPMDGVDHLPVSLFTLLIARERLGDLQKALTNLYGKLWDWGKEAYKNPR